MDVKNAFLNGILHEEAFVEQPKVFEDIHFLTMFTNSIKHCMVWNKPQGLDIKGWPISWLKKDITEGEFINSLHQAPSMLMPIIAQIYVDDIVFGSTSASKMQEFVN